MTFPSDPVNARIAAEIRRRAKAAKPWTDAVDLQVGKAIPAPSVNVNLSVVTFTQQSQTMNCPCCGYLGPLVLEREKRLKTLIRKLWRCQQCRATIEVTVRI